MTYQGSGGTRGSKEAPGGLRGVNNTPGAKKSIKQQNYDSKPWCKVPKVCLDPKGMVFTHFSGIWGHLDGLQQGFLVKKPNAGNQGFGKILLPPFPQDTWMTNGGVSEFSRSFEMLITTGKLPKRNFL